MNKETLYVVPFEPQKEQIDKWCYGSCGKAIVGMIDLGVCHGVTCRNVDCPHVEKEESDSADPIILRKLKPV